jgi:hypothetical protein
MLTSLINGAAAAALALKPMASVRRRLAEWVPSMKSVK